MAFTVAELVARLRADATQFSSGMRAAAGEVSSLQRTSVASTSTIGGAFSRASVTARGSLTQLKSTAMGVFAGGALLFGLDALINKTEQWGASVHALAQTFGITEHAAAQLQMQSQAMGISATMVGRVMLRLDKAATPVGGKLSSTGQALKDLGINLTDATGKALPLSQQIDVLSAAYDKSASKAQFFAQVLGPRGMMIAPLIANYGKLKAATAGLDFPVPSVDQLIALQRSQMEFQMLGITLGTKVVPFVAQTTGAVAGFFAEIGQRGIIGSFVHNIVSGTSTAQKAVIAFFAVMAANKIRKILSPLLAAVNQFFTEIAAGSATGAAAEEASVLTMEEAMLAAATAITDAAAQIVAAFQSIGAGAGAMAAEVELSATQSAGAVDLLAASAGRAGGVVGAGGAKGLFGMAPGALALGGTALGLFGVGKAAQGNALMGIGGAAAGGAAIGSIIPGVGTVAGAIGGAAVGGIAFGMGKLNKLLGGGNIDAQQFAQTLKTKLIPAYEAGMMSQSKWNDVMAIGSMAGLDMTAVSKQVADAKKQETVQQDKASQAAAQGAARVKHFNTALTAHAGVMQAMVTQTGGDWNQWVGQARAAARKGGRASVQFVHQSLAAYRQWRAGLATQFGDVSNTLQQFVGQNRVSAAKIVRALDQQLHRVRTYNRDWAKLSQEMPGKARVIQTALLQFGPDASAMLHSIVTTSGKTRDRMVSDLTGIGRAGQTSSRVISSSLVGSINKVQAILSHAMKLRVDTSPAQSELDAFMNRAGAQSITIPVHIATPGQHHRAGGGAITEPVVGVGQRSGDLWTFGERGVEWVSSGPPPGHGGGGRLDGRLRGRLRFNWRSGVVDLDTETAWNDEFDGASA